MQHKIVWEPTTNYSENSAARRFMNEHDIPTYEALLERSEDIHWFWDAFIRFAGIEFYEPYSQVVDLSGGFPFPKWFIGGKINVAHNALDKWTNNLETSHRTALIWEGENGEVRRSTFGELQADANRAANALKALGVEKGDRVAIFMPLIPETVMAVFGIYKLGAITVPLFSGFGAEALTMRLRDVEAKVVITADNFYRGGSLTPMKATLDKVLPQVKSVKAVILAQRVGECPMTVGRDYFWKDIVHSQSPVFETVHTDAEDVCMVSYSSGTSGKPKGIVQTHGGVAVKSAEFGLLVYDMRPDDVIYQITDFGWMMGQAPMFRGYAGGGTLLLYEGSPTYPNAHRMFELIEKHRISVFGAPATALRILKSQVYDAPEQHDLSSLRLLSHTGEPIDSDTWMWFFSWGKGRVPIVNVSGGTELFAEVLASNPMQPQKPTCLGVTPAISPVIVDDGGQPVPRGTQGYLCFRLPQPGQTRGFWKENNTRYLETYFPHGEHLWWHGDMAVMDEDGFWFHRGRADDVLKISGRRTGPGEIEDAINQFPGVLEAAVIGVDHPIKGQEIIAFAVPKGGVSLSGEAVRKHVADALGKPYEPGKVYFVVDLPKTRNAKIIRRLIKQHYLGEKLGDLSSLVNPQALDDLPRKD